MKRSAENQLTKDGGDENMDDSEGTGVRKASEEVLASRPMKGLPKRKTMAAASPSEPPSKPLFGSFQGFGSSAAPASSVPTAASDPKPNPFGSFSGFGTSNSSSTANPPPTFGNANGMPTVTSSTSAFPPPSKPPSGSLWSTAPTSSPAASSSNSNTRNASQPSTEYYSALRGLNQSTLEAIDKALKKDAFIELPLETISKSYQSHRRDIEAKLGAKASTSPPAPEAPKSAAPIAPPQPPSGGFFLGAQSSVPNFFNAPPGSSASFKPIPSFTLPTTSTSKPSNDKPTDTNMDPPKSTNLIGSFTSANGTNSNTTAAPTTQPFGSTFGKVEPASTSTPSSSLFGSGSLFGAKPKPEEAKPSEAGGSSLGGTSMYPFGDLPAPKAPAKPPATSFFSFGNAATTTPAVTPVQTPPSPKPAEKRPALSGFSFGSSGSFSFGSATPGLTPATGSLGNPAGFSFGSPPKDPGTVTPSPGTTAGLQAAAKAAPLFPPASSVASVAGSETPDEAPPVTITAGDVDVVLEGEQDEETLAFARAKLFRFKDGSWVDMGTGQFKLKKHKETGVARVLMRSDSINRIILNFRIHRELKPMSAEKPVNIKFNGMDEGKLTLFQTRFKEAPTAKKILGLMEDLMAQL